MAAENAGSPKGSEPSTEEKGEDFPCRPEEHDCAFYLRTGGCRYGSSCKFNHPPNKVKGKLVESAVPSPVVAKERRKGTFSESNGKVECKYYLTPGGCKYGKDCKYAHQENTGEVPVELNFLGLPMRPGEKECTYYMRTGGCKYSTNCRYHHPDPTAVGRQDPLSGYQSGAPPQQHALPAQMPMTSWPLQGTLNEPITYLDAPPPPSFVPGYYLPPHPNQQWNGYQAPVNTSYPTGMHMQHPSLGPNMNDTNRRVGGPMPQKVQPNEYPERPGQPECLFFMKTGSCKFKGACKFHHPKSRLPKTPGVELNPVGLPFRPDQTVCTHYSRHGVCKYGQSCRYNHPTEPRPSAPPASATSSTKNCLQDSSIQPQFVSKIESGSNGSNQDPEW